MMEPLVTALRNKIQEVVTLADKTTFYGPGARLREAIDSLAALLSRVESESWTADDPRCVDPVNHRGYPPHRCWKERRVEPAPSKKPWPYAVKYCPACERDWRENDNRTGLDFDGLTCQHYEQWLSRVEPAPRTETRPGLFVANTSTSIFHQSGEAAPHEDGPTAGNVCFGGVAGATGDYEYRVEPAPRPEQRAICNPPESIYCGRHDCPTCRGPFWREKS